MADVSEADLNSLFDYMDVGKNDYITFEEFALAWTEQENTGTGPCCDLIQRMKKCRELLFLTEADEARQILYQANLGCKVKGTVQEAEAIARASFVSAEGRTYKIDESDSHAAHDGFRVTCSEGGVVICEAGVLLIPSLTGYSNVLTRRITGKTTAFHTLYKDFVTVLENTPAYTEAQVDLELESAQVDL